METPRTPERIMKQSQHSLELFPRERQVLIMTANGNTNKDIAKALNLSERAIERTLRRARHRLGAANSTNAVAIAIKRRGITLDDIADLSG